MPKKNEMVVAKTQPEVSTMLAVSGDTTAAQAPLMTRSAGIDKIAAALARAQSEFRSIKKGSVVDFTNKAGIRVHYTYADLASILAAIRPTLAKHKLSFSQMPVRAGKGILITTILMHVSGQFLQSTLALELMSGDVKEAGTIITYGRRYALASILGIVTDDDVDAPEQVVKKGKELSPRKKKERDLHLFAANVESDKALKAYLKANYKSEHARKLTDEQLDAELSRLDKLAKVIANARSKGFSKDKIREVVEKRDGITNWMEIPMEKAETMLAKARGAEGAE